MWIQSNINLNLDYLEQSQYMWAEVLVFPFCYISVVKSEIPEPRGKTKQLILGGLLDIYYSWKEELDKRGEPYYLKIWLYEPRFSKSQVVCAIGDRIEYYENTFYKPGEEKNIHPDNYGTQKSRLSEIKWEHRSDEDYYDNTNILEPEYYRTPEDYEENKKWFEKLLKQPHRSIILDKPIGEITETYYFKRGSVWIGSEN